MGILCKSKKDGTEATNGFDSYEEAQTLAEDLNKHLCPKYAFSNPNKPVKNWKPFQVFRAWTKEDEDAWNKLSSRTSSSESSGEGKET